jgi:hypothetical protein
VKNMTSKDNPSFNSVSSDTAGEFADPTIPISDPVPTATPEGPNETIPLDVVITP